MLEVFKGALSDPGYSIDLSTLPKMRFLFESKIGLRAQAFGGSVLDPSSRRDQLRIRLRKNAWHHGLPAERSSVRRMPRWNREHTKNITYYNFMAILLLLIRKLKVFKWMLYILPNYLKIANVLSFSWRNIIGVLFV